MKFSVEKVLQGGARLGLLNEFEKHNIGLSLETPLCLLYTRAGSVPNLSIDTLHYVQHLPPVALMPMNLLAEHHEALQEFQRGLAEFAALKEFSVCCTMQDPSTAIPCGYNDKSSIALWARGGKMKVDPELFMKIQEAFQPNWFQSLSDADTNKASSKKRSRKAVDNTLNFLDEVLERKSKSKVLAKAAVFGSIVGGFSKFERESIARETTARNVDGFCLEGFQSDGKEFSQFDDEDFIDVFHHTIKHLPEDKPRMMLAVWRPDAVLQAVHAGVDIFDTSYAYTATEKGHALVFDYDYSKRESIVTSPESESAKLKQLENGYTIDLNDKRHNLHHYIGFFSTLRQALKEDKLLQLENLVNKMNKQKPTNFAND